ncbi:MAG: hypothetical protein WC998_06155 [Candidatus Paceibacterota bacterium]
MADTFKVIGSGTLTTSNATLATITAGGTFFVGFISLANKATADATCFITFNSINIVPGKTITAKDAIFPPVQGAVVTAGATIQGYSGTATSIDYYISGDEAT